MKLTLILRRVFLLFGTITCLSVVLPTRLISSFSPFFLPEWIDPAAPILAPPSWNFWAGTDELGRNCLSRIFFGTGYSLLFALAVSVGVLILGVFIGGITSFLPKRLQSFVLLFYEVVASIPFIPMALICLVVYPGGIIIVGALKICLGWTPLASLVNMECHLIRNSPMMSAGISQGLSPLTLFYRFLLPNALQVASRFVPLCLFSSMLSLATLDFFGLGFPIPTPTLSEGFRAYLENPEAWWLFVFPLITLVGLLTVISTFSPNDFIRARTSPY